MSRCLLFSFLALAGATSAVGEVHFFTDEQSFYEYRVFQGSSTLVGVEHFDCCAHIPAGERARLTNPLCWAVPNVDPDTGYGFPEGLCQVMCVAASAGNLVGWATLDDPPDVLVAPERSEPYTRAVFAEVGTSQFGPPVVGYTAVGFWLADPTQRSIRLNVYDIRGLLIGSTLVQTGPEWIFCGVVVDFGDTAIGVIELASPGDEVADDWALYAQLGCPFPGASGQYCTADIWPNNGDGRWDYDLDGDCVVDLRDLAELLSNYGLIGPAGRMHEAGDVEPENGDGIWVDAVDGDGDVDLADLAELLAQYGDDCNLRPPGR